jgi:hypothetical protein
MTVDPPPEKQDTEHAVGFVSEVSHINNPGKDHPSYSAIRATRANVYFSGLGITIEKLPPEILEEIFRFYRQDAMALSRGRPWEWHRLTHVCQTWRSIILHPTNRLGLQLFCTNGTPVRNTLHCWPGLPIVMRYGVQAFGRAYGTCHRRGTLTRTELVTAALRLPS